MLNIVTDVLQNANADLIVIPHSTAGTISAGFVDVLRLTGLNETAVPGADLGDVLLRQLPSGKRYKFVAFVCTVHEQTSSYTTLFKVVAGLNDNLPQNIGSIAMPLICTGAGHLDVVKTFTVLRELFRDFLPTIEISIFIPNTLVRDEISKQARAVDTPPEKLIFDYVVDDLRKINWVKEMCLMDQFYYKLAREKYLEFEQFNWQVSEYERILKDFIKSKVVFSKFLYRFDETDMDFRFLLLCGELVAYIDRHAYNKKVWNQYSDKRTLARSSVNQTRWIQGLITFKIHGNKTTALSPSICNALSYLKQPAENLTMLSEKHRLMVSQVLFNGETKGDFFEELNRYFTEKGLICKDPANKGVLFSRILYTPDIRDLWDDVFPESEEELLEGSVFQANRPISHRHVDATRKRNLRTLMHSDIYAQIDLLNYEAYASIIARLITSNLSQPPFNISIYAPWGKGKTSLMRFVQKKIKPDLITDTPIKETPSTSILTLRSWLNNTGTIFKEIEKLSHPVIWFNAWKFQKSEQVWAGLADEIIRQFSAQLSTTDREKFWLKLNLKRVDRVKLKNQLLFKFVQNMLIPFAWVILGICLGIVLHLINWHQIGSGLFGENPWLSFLLPSIIGTFAAFLTAKRKWQKPPEFDLGKFVLQPEYRQKMGYLQSVEDDLRQAIDLLIDKKKPAVIFIDDLDRCSPQVISEVVEALNAFMTGDLRDCYFIIGHDPQMVTASLDASYEKVAGKLGKIGGESGSIGRFFLEKFSQLSLNIPVLEYSQKQSYVESLLASLDNECLPDNTKQDDLLFAYERIEQSLDTLPDPEDIFTVEKENLEAQIMQFNPERVAIFQERILSSAFNSYKMADNELENLILNISDYLDSPRTIKRFINLYLFYHFFRLTIPGRRIAEVDDETLGLWLLITVRWPLLVQAIQWDTEMAFFDGANAVERAKKFDAMIDQCKDQDSFSKAMTEKFSVGLSWQCDPDLFHMCRGEDGERVRLCDIVDAGIW
jgi:hypothetical protein